jgi:hypothetical protein
LRKLFIFNTEKTLKNQKKFPNVFYEMTPGYNEKIGDHYGLGVANRQFSDFTTVPTFLTANRQTTGPISNINYDEL